MSHPIICLEFHKFPLTSILTRCLVRLFETLKSNILLCNRYLLFQTSGYKNYPRIVYLYQSFVSYTIIGIKINFKDIIFHERQSPQYKECWDQPINWNSRKRKLSLEKCQLLGIAQRQQRSATVKVWGQRVGVNYSAHLTKLISIARAHARKALLGKLSACRG